MDDVRNLADMKISNLSGAHPKELVQGLVMEKAIYQKVKVMVVALATEFFDGDEAARARLRRKADFFPISKGMPDDGHRSVMIRLRGNMFLVEDTPGGEKEIFALLLPLM